MSFLMEQAGGQAFTGKQRVMTLCTLVIHERESLWFLSHEILCDLSALIVLYNYIFIVNDRAVSC